MPRPDNIICLSSLSFKFLASHKLILLFFLVFVSAGLHGQTAVVSGVVTDDLGDIVEKTAVAVKEDPKRSTYTDAMGRYSIEVESGKPLTLLFYDLAHVQHT